MKGKALRKHSLHEKTAASVLLKPFNIIIKYILHYFKKELRTYFICKINALGKSILPRYHMHSLFLFYISSINESTHQSEPKSYTHNYGNRY